MPDVKSPHALPKLPAKKVKLTEEGLQKSLQRLYEHPCERRRARTEEDKKEIEENAKKNTVRPRPPGKEFRPSERLAAQCQRLYETPLIQQKNTMAHLEQKYASQLESSRPPRVKLTDERTEETVHRLYVVSLESKKQVREQIEKKVYGEAPAPPKLDSETLKENVSKLYSKALETRSEKLNALEDKYMWKATESKKISKQEVADLVSRLGAKG